MIKSRNNIQKYVERRVYQNAFCVMKDSWRCFFVAFLLKMAGGNQ